MNHCLLNVLPSFKSGRKNKTKESRGQHSKSFNNPKRGEFVSSYLVPPKRKTL